jgi:hypothetical protein
MNLLGTVTNERQSIVPSVDRLALAIEIGIVALSWLLPQKLISRIVVPVSFLPHPYLVPYSLSRTVGRKVIL